MEEREFYRPIDAKPKKRILENKANNCTYAKAIGEIIDNCLDYWRELEYPTSLQIDICNRGGQDGVIEISWNMGIPEERWEPLVRPGDRSHKDPLSIGVWGEGFKIAIFAIGREVEIFTRTEEKDAQTYVIHIPRDWLKNDDWTIPVFRMGTSSIDNGETLLKLQHGIRPVPGTPDEALRYIEETFGTRILREKEDRHAIRITVDGIDVKPKSYGLSKDIEDKFAFPPGMEPTRHLFNENGIEVTMITGLLAEADADNYGVYMYGNGRLFASRLHDERVGFGAKANSKIPSDHPHAKRLQVHIFFDGPPALIPWAAPLKDDFNHESTLGPKVAEWIEKYLTPYALFVKGSLQSEILPYSRKWQSVPEDKKIDRFFSKAERKKFGEKDLKKMWDMAPPEIKNGMNRMPAIEEWNHTNRKNKPREVLKFDPKLVRKMTNTFDQRDKGKLTSVDVAHKLLSGEVSIAPPRIDSGPEGDEEPQDSGRDENGPIEVTKRLVVNMNTIRHKELVQMTGRTDHDEMVDHLAMVYIKFRSLENEPKIKKGGRPRDDLELVERIREELS